MLRSVRPHQLRLRFRNNVTSLQDHHSHLFTSSMGHWRSYHAQRKFNFSHVTIVSKPPLVRPIARYSSKFPYRSITSKVSSSSGNSGGKSNSRKGMFNMFAKILKVLRIPIVVSSVYVLGYQQGIVDYSRNPTEKKRELMISILSGVGCDDPNKIHIVHEGVQLRAMLASTSALCAAQRRIGRNGYEKGADRQMQLRNIASIAERIVKTSKAYVDLKLSETDKKLHPIEYEKWHKAKDRVGNSYTNWSFVLIDVPVPNAFVSESMPQTIFVTTALLEQFVDNDDELGLILGHEVSHLIHGHMSERNSSALFLSVAEVVLLSLDPTEGLMSVFIVSTIAFLKSLLNATFSRETEKEADELGIILAARACFDTSKAPLVFKKMHEHNLEEFIADRDSASPIASIESNGAAENIAESIDKDIMEKQGNNTNENGNWSDIMSTHPSDLERYSKLVLASKEENAEKYSHCLDVRRRFFKSLGMRTSNES